MDNHQSPSAHWVAGGEHEIWQERANVVRPTFMGDINDDVWNALASADDEEDEDDVDGRGGEGRANDEDAEEHPEDDAPEDDDGEEFAAALEINDEADAAAAQEHGDGDRNGDGRRLSIMPIYF